MLAGITMLSAKRSSMGSLPGVTISQRSPSTRLRAMNLPSVWSSSSPANARRWMAKKSVALLLQVDQAAPGPELVDLGVAQPDADLLRVDVALVAQALAPDRPIVIGHGPVEEVLRPQGRPVLRAIDVHVDGVQVLGARGLGICQHGAHVGQHALFARRV